MIFAVDHKLGASLVEARTPDGAVRKARRYFGQYAEPITIPENQDEAIASAKSMGAGIIAFVLLLLSVGVAQAEPLAQMPLSEFKQMVVRVDKLQQREKLQQELIGHLQEKDKVQTDYIAKIEQANETIQAYATKLEEVNAQLAAESKDNQFSTLAEGAGYGATAAAVIGVVIRKLILKF